MSSVTWIASSLVGTMTSAAGCFAARSPASVVTSRCRIGMPKASVLPVPVRAWPMMSWPFMASGSVSAWIGNVVCMPAASSALQMTSSTPRSRNGTACVS